MIEVCFLQFLTGPNAPLRLDEALGLRSTRKRVARSHQGARGAKSLVISSDLGQQGNMTHPDGLENAIAAMKAEGISDADIDTDDAQEPGAIAWVELDYGAED